ncbi:hypothetical protein VNO80_08595 [Phaseolus coccineus]|uniref:Uncharacterized protein n=1 Tax=Phaseolus coccineus TaxID=3886 RepID=A0AAN9N4M9_PHACN
MLPIYQSQYSIKPLPNKSTQFLFLRIQNPIFGSHGRTYISACRSGWWQVGDCHDSLTLVDSNDENISGNNDQVESSYNNNGDSKSNKIKERGCEMWSNSNYSMALFTVAV